MVQIILLSRNGLHEDRFLFFVKLGYVIVRKQNSNLIEERRDLHA
jgi:hypothetical protein